MVWSPVKVNINKSIFLCFMVLQFRIHRNSNQISACLFQLITNVKQNHRTQVLLSHLSCLVWWKTNSGAFTWLVWFVGTGGKTVSSVLEQTKQLDQEKMCDFSNDFLLDYIKSNLLIVNCSENNLIISLYN